MDNLLSETEQLQERMDLMEMEHRALQQLVKSQNNKITSLLTLMCENMQGMMDIVNVPLTKLEEDE
tara:strand:+ start:1311 stop:1508 length:198 start_codon:yes stop_codon:yes gene_type:complete